MMKTNRLFIFMLSAGLLLSCDDIVEKDISSKELYLLAPADGAELVANSVAFWWDPLEGATSYEFHLVKPSFYDIEEVVVDSVVTGSLVALDLTPGDYSWEVSAFNGAYATSYFYRSFQLTSPDSIAPTDISKMKVELRAPADSLVLSSENDVIFWWDYLDGADEYEIIVASLTGDGKTKQLIHLGETGESTETVSLDSGAYTWAVRAFNAGYTTNVTSRTLFVD